MPAHVRRLTDTSYLAAAAAVFVAAAAIQLGLYRWLLQPALAAGADAVRARSSFLRWIMAAFAYQALVLVAAGGYMAANSRSHPGGVAWIAPPMAALLGSALPLQLVVASALRAARR